LVGKNGLFFLEVLISRITGHVGTGTHFSGYGANQACDAIGSGHSDNETPQL